MKYNRFGHLSNPGRTEHLKEFLGIGTKYDELVGQEQALFGLDDWYIDTMYACDRRLERMTENYSIAEIVATPDLQRATIYFHEELMKCPSYSELEVIDHELAHLIINPWSGDDSAVFDTGSGLDDTKCIHIARACELLRREDPLTQVSSNDSLEQIVEKARYLTFLTENDWRVQTEKIDSLFLGIVDGEKRLPAVAYSTYYQNNIGFALFSAREIILKIDPPYIEEKDLSLPDIILGELFRVVLNPYRKPDRTATQKRQLRHIMKACKGLGWARHR